MYGVITQKAPHPVSYSPRFRLRYKLLLVIVPLYFNLQGQRPEVVVQQGHNADISTICFSPNGEYILTGSYDGTAKLWDRFGRELVTFAGHIAPILALDFSPDGQRVVTGGKDRKAIVWSISGKQLYSLSHSSDVQAVAFSPDGKWILTGARGLRLWNQKQQLVLEVAKYQAIYSVAFTPDGKQLLSGSGGEVVLWDRKGKAVQMYEGTKGVRRVAISEDGTKVLAQGHQVVVWQRDGHQLVKIAEHWRGMGIESVAFSRNGKHILTSYEDGSALMWNSHGRWVQHFKGGETPLWALAFSPDANTIATGGQDGIVRLWNKHGEQWQSLDGYRNFISSASFSPDGHSILLGMQDKTARMLDLSGRGQLSFVGHEKPVWSVAISPDGHTIATGSSDGTARLWDSSGKELKSLDGHRGRISSLVFSPDGNSILTACGDYGEFGSVSQDTVIRIWKLDGDLRSTLEGHRDVIFGLSFSPNGGHLLSTSADRSLIKWNHEGKIEQKFDFTDMAFSVTYSPVNDNFLIGNGYGPSQLMDSAGQTIARLPGHTAPVFSVAFSPDGSKLLTASYDGIANIWTNTGEHLHKLTGHSREISSAVFSPDGKLVLTGGVDGVAKVWDAASGALLLNCISFSSGTDDWLIINAEGYYMGSTKISKYIHSKIGSELHAFEQFDLRLNRPDKVLETMLEYGADSILMEQYRQAYLKRLKKNGFTEVMVSQDYHVPSVSILNRADIPETVIDEELVLQLQAYDRHQLLDRLQVFVNDVPLYGSKGLDLQSLKTKRITKDIIIPLSSGKNKIQVSVMNRAGAESLLSTVFTNRRVPQWKYKADLYVLSLGVSEYESPGADLNYAAKDAQDLAHLFQSATGFDKIHLKTLTDEQVNREEVLGLRGWLEKTRVDDQVIVFVSGHGVLDKDYNFYFATPDIDFLNPSKEGIPYEDLEGLLDGIPARKKLLLIDACHSGEIDKEDVVFIQEENTIQGKVSFRNFGTNMGTKQVGIQTSFDLMQRLFVNLRRGTGASVISSASGVEFAIEGEKWKNGVFTYSLLEGLRHKSADLNGDGQVMVSELQSFVSKEVASLTQGQQQPTYRMENISNDWRIW
ncbi:MAG: caspase family protein [Saprospiraceae bacterium]